MPVILTGDTKQSTNKITLPRVCGLAAFFLEGQWVAVQATQSNVSIQTIIDNPIQFTRKEKQDKGIPFCVIWMLAPFQLNQGYFQGNYHYHHCFLRPIRRYYNFFSAEKQQYAENRPVSRRDKSYEIILVFIPKCKEIEQRKVQKEETTRNKKGGQGQGGGRRRRKRKQVRSGRRAVYEKVDNSLRMWEARRLEQKFTLKLSNLFVIEVLSSVWAWTRKGSVGC